MLITLCYCYMWLRFQRFYSGLILHNLPGLHRRSLGLSFGQAPGPASNPQSPASDPHRPASNPQSPASDPHRQACDPLAAPRAASPPPGGVFLQRGNKAVYLTELQTCEDMSKWNVLLECPLDFGPQIETVSFVVHSSGARAGCPASHRPNKKVLKWSDYCVPLACTSGQPFRTLAQASVDNFSRLGVAFIEDRLRLDNEHLATKIVPVLLQESSINALLRNLQRPKTSSPFVPPDEKLSCRKASLLLPPEERRLQERRGSEPLHSSQALCSAEDPEDRSLGNNQHMEGHGHHLHLSSCNECLELESSTILSVKYASVENIPDLPDDNIPGLHTGDHGPVEQEHDVQSFLDQRRACDSSSKPPNILVFTGGSQDRFHTIRQLLAECVNLEDNIIYDLQPQQALNDPWLDNTRLLVLAEEEPLTLQLQTRFLTYLNLGGKVLGLSSTLCPAGVCLETNQRRQRKLSQLSFTREDNTEVDLNVLASGKVYIRNTEGGGEVELWGELKEDDSNCRDMVIIRVTHGDGGEAVLCQIHFESTISPESFMSEGCYKLQASEGLRYEVLTEILTSLGLSCEQKHSPVPSPIHLLATSADARDHFLQWLQSSADEHGVLTAPNVSFILSSCSDLKAPPPSASPPSNSLPSASPPSNSLPLLTDSPQSSVWPHFSFETYRDNLRTSQLGHTLLYAEVVTSTMDLLQGLTLKLPSDLGLIAVAAQQSQGRGRGGNAWLSPPGCAMFTVKLEVEVSSKLGQRIPFLQHLSALAVVEAVRTLPGYENIDLRLKWPNDIYYSNLRKVGGVLVTSTVIGSTFHLLIGCGFNVTNSSPSVCINDLIQQHNQQHRSSLQPLSCAQLIGRTVTCLEALVCSFQRAGAEAVLPAYYKRWLHSETTVRLWSEDGPEAQVLGLDQNGFLQVHSRERGVVSVEPDGNSFDMLKNLVVMKLQKN